MLKITVPEQEFFDEESKEFIFHPGMELNLEHSLVSLSKWESIWEKPFLSKTEKTDAETESYIECMVLDSEIPEGLFSRLSAENINQINEYIAKKMTATWFSERDGKKNQEVITAEIIYYWMLSLSMPFECQYWHLNKLLALIKVCNQKNSPPKKMSAGELAARNRELNAQRLKEHNTRG